jgi:hypothetical protein
MTTQQDYLQKRDHDTVHFTSLLYCSIGLLTIFVFFFTYIHTQFKAQC